MLQTVHQMAQSARRVLRNESGIETGEWLVILAIVTTVGIAVYGTTAGGPLGAALTTIITAVKTAVTPV